MDDIILPSGSLPNKSELSGVFKERPPKKCKSAVSQSGYIDIVYGDTVSEIKPASNASTLVFH